MARGLTIDGRFCGFPGHALGAYVGGAMSVAVSSALEVTLRQAVPVERVLDLELVTGGGIRLKSGENTLAEGSRWTETPAIPEPISLTEAGDAARSYLGFEPHPFVAQYTCFCCGPKRPVGDGLRIFPGRVDGGQRVAAPWTPCSSDADPDGKVPVEIIWSALDCPAIWALITSAPPDSPEEVVSGKIATEVIGEVRAGSPHVIVGWPIGAEGRKRIAGAALFSSEGELLAHSTQTCVVVEGGVPLGSQRWS